MPTGDHSRRLLHPDEALYRRLIDLAPDAMIGVDELGRIVLVNAQAETLFGYRRDELIGQTIELLVPDAARSVHPAHRRSYLEDPHPRPMGLGLQLAARRSDGSEFPAEISLGAVETDRGRIISASIRDVSDRQAADREREQLVLQAERERSERQLVQAQRLESLGQLAGGVAHDFNNLLAVISNYAAFAYEAIEQVLDTTGDEALRTPLRDINQIERAATAAAHLTRQLLTFARRDLVRPQPLDLAAVVAETADMLQRSLGKDVQLSVHSQPGLLPVSADHGQLQQVLVNLAVNARQAMPQGGVLTIGTRNARDEHGAWVELTVSDTGAGMDAATMARVFEPFFTTRASDQGTGLGLSTVYGIVSQAGGTAAFSSQVGVGTTFTARFPAALDVPDHHHSAVAPTGARTRATVLVVDDEGGIRDVVQRILLRHDHVVLVAGGGVEALRVAQRHAGPIDILLTDVVMPGLNGPDLAAALLGARPTMRVVFMSGYTGTDLAARITLDRDVELVTKPFTEAQLLSAIEAVLHH
ncbi:MAG: PAS domain S-box protein [Ilumatobacteraceae bacterium]